ncbi:phage protease [Alteromonas sp. C1M14]|uniref:phage protease n=1 Tax=Alteromonas sp. C1M14 TaxID=2841567 RepID=UPI001C0A0A61|nr:phage protease [Alteromonas sp. C1M14]MBU2979013.1 phage protease [Alteromonas sp. C1M14]
MGQHNNRYIQLAAPTDTRTVRFLASAVSVDAERQTSVVTVTRTGQFFDPRYGQFEITPVMLQSMIDNFNANVFGQDIYVDRAHKSSDGAAGTIRRLFLDGNKLRAEVAWTPFGQDLIKRKGYRYLSAEFIENFVTNEHPFTEHGPTLLGAGLVVRPCIKNLDRVELSESDDFTGMQLISEQLATELSEESNVEKLIQLFTAALENKKLSETAINKWVATATKALESVSDETQQKQLMAQLQDTALSLAESTPESVPNITLNASTTGLSKEDVVALVQQIEDDRIKVLEGVKAKLDANVKLFSETINGTKSLSEDVKAKLLKASELVTGDMTESQVKAMATQQITLGEELESQSKLAGMGFTGAHGPMGSVMLASGHNANAMKLAQDVRKQLKLTSSFANGSIRLSDTVDPFVDNVLTLFDGQYNQQLMREHKVLSGEEGSISDTSLPYAFRREVIREALHDLNILQLVATSTDPTAQTTTQIPYEERKAFAGRTDGLVFERGGIPKAGVSQKMDTAYINAMKIAFNVSNEMMHFTRVSGVNWDAWGRHVATCSRILREIVVRRLANEMLRMSDSYQAASISDEDIASQLDGSTSEIKTAQFPIVRPHQVYDLQGNPVGTASNPLVLTISGTVIEAFDGTGQQATGTYYIITNANLGYITLVNEAGEAVTPTSSTATISYSAATNVAKFDIDLPAESKLEEHLNGLLRKIGSRKAVMKDERYITPNFLLMSNTLNDTCSNADQFVVSLKRDGADTTGMGDLEKVKGLPAWGTNAPGIDLGDERILMGERGTSNYVVAKAFAIGEMQEGRDPTTGELNGTKEAYGEEYNAIHTPKPLANRYTSVLVYSATNR